MGSLWEATSGFVTVFCALPWIPVHASALEASGENSTHSLREGASRIWTVFCELWYLAPCSVPVSPRSTEDWTFLGERFPCSFYCSTADTYHALVLAAMEEFRLFSK